MFKYMYYSLFPVKLTLENIIDDQLASLKRKMDDVAKDVKTVSFDENYTYQATSQYASSDLMAKGYLPNDPELWSQKYQFLKVIQALRGAGNLKPENLHALKINEKFSRALEGVFSMTSKIVSLIEKSFEHEQPLETFNPSIPLKSKSN